MTHVVVLTAQAGVPDDFLAEAEKICGATPRRLGPRSADIDGTAGMAAELHAALGGSVDVNLVAKAGRAKRLLIADMDSTIIPVECIDEIADVAGVGARVAEITERAMQGELDFEGALRARVGLLRGLPVEALETVWTERVSLNPGARALVQTMNARGAVTALVSGGFTYFADRVAEAAGFRFAQANTLLEDGGRLTGEPGEPILGRQAKLDALERLCAEHGIGLEAAIAVGDGANDLAMVEAAGLGVAYHAKPALAAKADAVLAVSDLTALLALQGIPEADYAA
ncbi:phosphoserine phosphatase SerB [Albimonas sp. CAU 1670]|uniref:phosphoserine phosphatase SerB n=1 Tax=Albimonas sp. CAU 1670 TaxID=3032599 RepID=UPI0023D9E600|nr:phosphoserine phosphatase SerB [Albimonas sp. CAU 1670]MDF2233047.1 phosphoserine phosphatase SerB [Albimonas sp. CAU 1670]